MNEDDFQIEADGSEELGGSGADPVAKVGKLKTQLDQLKAESREYLDGWQRAKADYVNALKRFEEERKNAIGLGKHVSVIAFLPAMDSLDRAEAAGAIPEAFQGIAKQLHDAARQLGLEKFGAVGEKFDPILHEALGQDPTEDQEKDDTITAVLEPGWRSNEAPIRPAKVRIAHFG